jgi:hypothetical protein
MCGTARPMPSGAAPHARCRQVRTEAPDALELQNWRFATGSALIAVEALTLEQFNFEKVKLARSA